MRYPRVDAAPYLEGRLRSQRVLIMDWPGLDDWGLWGGGGGVKRAIDE